MPLALNGTGTIFKKCSMSNHRPETVKRCASATCQHTCQASEKCPHAWTLRYSVNGKRGFGTWLRTCQTPPGGRTIPTGLPGHGRCPADGRRGRRGRRLVLLHCGHLAGRRLRPDRRSQCLVRNPRPRPRLGPRPAPPPVLSLPAWRRPQVRSIPVLGTSAGSFHPADTGRPIWKEVRVGFRALRRGVLT